MTTTRISRTHFDLLLLLCTLLASCCLAWTPLLSPSNSRIHSSRLYEAHPQRADIDVVFGSDAVEGDEDELDNEREQAARRKQISVLLQKQEEEFREERRLKKWGKYANATSKDEVQALEQEERSEIAKENSKKQQLAQESGITLELLGPKEESLWDEDGNVQITAGSKASFFSNVDEELQQEWQELAEDSETQLVNGAMTSRDALQGVRVGSAGGWSLEVFPGDFVVHR